MFMRTQGAFLAVLAISLTTNMFWAAPVSAEIGVTAAVNPQAWGTQPERDQRILDVGANMVSDERVETGEVGRVQLLFVDGSALTVGPNSDMTLDRFVYDPDTKTGELALSATKGVFRFVGGKISKTRPIRFRTKVATIGIRGGIGIIDIGPIVRVLFLYGDELTIEVGNAVRRLTEPGFLVEVTDGKIGTPRLAPTPLVRSLQDSFEQQAAVAGATTQFVAVDTGTVEVVATLNSDTVPAAIAPREDGFTPASGDQATLASNAENFDSEAKGKAPQDSLKNQDSIAPVGQQQMPGALPAGIGPGFSVAFDDVLNRFIFETTNNLANLNTIGGFNGVANIDGDVVGVVTVGQVQTFIDNSRFNLNFDFGQRAGTLNVVNFGVRNLLFDVETAAFDTIYSSAKLVGNQGDVGSALGFFTNQNAQNENELGTVGFFEFRNAFEGSVGIGVYASN